MGIRLAGRLAIVLFLSLSIMAIYSLTATHGAPTAPVAQGPRQALVVGDTWALTGQYDQAETSTLLCREPLELPSNASVMVTVEAPGVWVWDEGASVTANLNLTLQDLSNLTGVRLDTLECYLFSFHGGGMIATSGIQELEVNLIKATPMLLDVAVTFTRGFRWDLVEEGLWIGAYLVLEANFTTFTDNTAEGFAAEPFYAIWVKCVPPGYFGRTVETTYTLVSVNTTSGFVNVSIATRYIVDGHEYNYTYYKNYNATVFRPSIDLLFEPWFLMYTEDPIWAPPLLLVEGAGGVGPAGTLLTWEALGADWVDWVASETEANNVTMTGSFSFEDAILANRKVRLAVFSLDYPISSYSEWQWGGERGFENLTGTYHVAWKYEVETGALLAVDWQEDLAYTSEWGWNSALYTEEEHTSIELPAAVASASFEFGEELAPPSLEIVSVEPSATDVKAGDTVGFDVVVVNNGDIDAEGAILGWSSPYFTGTNNITLDVPAGQEVTAHFDLTAQSEEDVTASITFTVYYAGEAHDTYDVSVHIHVPIAAIAFRSARTSAEEVLEGRTLTLTVEVANEGDRLARGVLVRWESEGFTGEQEKTVDIRPGETVTVSFSLKAVSTGSVAIDVFVSFKGELVGHETLTVIISKVVEPTPTTTTAIASGAAAGVVAAGISIATAGVSGVSAAAAAAAPTVSAAATAAPAVSVAPAAAAPRAEQARGGFFSKILSGIKYLLGKRKKKRVEPPKNSLKLTLGLVILSAAFAVAPLALTGTPLSLTSIPTSIMTSTIGFSLALSGLSLFVRRVKFYRDFGIEVDKREKAYLALTFILGIWGAVSSALGLLNVLVSYLASIPLSAPAFVVAAYTLLDMRSWA